MKKLISIILLILTFCQCTSLISYADCILPEINIEEINLEKTLKNVDWVTQNSDDKTLIIVRFEKIPSLKATLLKFIKDAFTKLIRAENSKIEPAVIEYMGLAMVDIAAGRSGLDSKATQKVLEDAKTYITEENLRNLPVNEKVLAISDGKKSSALATITDTALSFGGAGMTTLGVVKLAGASSALALTGAAVTALLAGGALVFVAGAAYNKYCIMPISHQASDAVDRYQELYKQVRDAILSHEWIGNNVLLMATSTEAGCTGINYKFGTVKEIKYQKSQDAINWDFARAECLFLGKDHDDCRRAALKVIDCIWENSGKPSLCDANPYFESTNIDPTRWLGD
ncbi:MAG: hypothetical protein RUMPE_01201 [Eubacteriales bacterium SKADARSKE-1]|nr:hypothetical protein [Eubacteriales bacterium SKADARSKE-1]MDQ5984165.1 hypothetical protein [Eubacteriales bacterium SKADARSKE-1]